MSISVRMRAWLAILTISLPLTAMQAQGRSAPRSSVSSKPGTPPQPYARQEIALGRYMAAQIVSHSTLWGGKQVTEYVERIGQSLVAASAARQKFTFVVLYSTSPEVNSFPGGYVLVHSAVISLAETEAELAAVLAHELAHLNAGHRHVRMRRTPRVARTALVPLGPVGWQAATETLMISWATDGLSAWEECRVDNLVVRYLDHAGYDPSSAFTALAGLELKIEPGAIKNEGSPEFDSRGGARHTCPREAIAQLPRARARLVSTSEFESVRAEVRDYDDMYSRALGVPKPGEQSRPPQLTPRPAF